MFSIDWILVGFLFGAVVFGLLARRAPHRVWYVDQDGDGVSARTACGYAALICLVLAFAQAVRCLRTGG